jgi:hypothetical protein
MLDVGMSNLNQPAKESAAQHDLGVGMKQIYKITYPTGKIYIGKDEVGSYRYFGSPSIEIVNADFATLPEEVRRDYTVRKQILWESETATNEELSEKEIEMIRKHQSNNPTIGHNRHPPFKSPPV